MILYFILQLPASYGIRIDIDQFFSSFSMLNDTSKRVAVHTWDLAPRHCMRRRDWPAYSDVEMGQPEDDSAAACPSVPPSTTVPTLNDDDFIDQEAICAEKRVQWDRYYHHTACHIPYIVCKSKGEMPLVVDELGIETGILPRAGEGRDIDGAGESEVDSHSPSPPIRGGRPPSKFCLYFNTPISNHRLAKKPQHLKTTPLVTVSKSQNASTLKTFYANWQLTN